MPGQGRLWGRRWFLLLGIALGTGTNAAYAAPADDPAIQDARLSSVSFVDAQNGWAVGDRGAIWHTADGGAHWQLQASGVTCALSSVQFLDAKNGWAAGGYTQPYTHATTGVLLRTKDGGRSWKEIPKLLLPAITRLQFFDQAKGWAITQPSALFPAGVCNTEDGGRTWTALPAAEGKAWLGGSFLGAELGVLVGSQGSIATVRGKTAELIKNADFGLRSLHRVVLSSQNAGWLVGDGGLVLRSEDGGASWQTPASDPPAALRDSCDLHALAVRGAHIWAAGSPGSRVLHSSDGGKSWATHSTGQTLPLYDLQFVDDLRGWAVGELGTILATSDGGQTWTRQRSGGTRAALFGIFSRPSDIPLELLARLSADEGYLAAIEVLNRQDLETPSPESAFALRRSHEAVAQAGGSATATAWRFPARPAALQLAQDDVVELWNRTSDGQGLDRLDAYLVSRIRMWRPDVVFTSPPASKSAESTAALVNQIVLRAVERAADPTRYTEQIGELGLAPWKARKIFACLKPGETGTSNLDTTQFSAHHGGAIADLASGARGLVSASYAPPATTLGFRLLVDHIPQELGKRDFFSGITLQPGGEARRLLGESPQQNLDALRRSAQARRNLQAILTKSESKNGADGRYLAEVGDATRNLEVNHAADVLYQLGQRYYRQGRWELAAESFDLLVQRYPKHALCGPALVWLVQYYASSEAAWRMQARQQLTIERVAASGKEQDDQPAPVQPAGGAAGPAQVRHAGGVVIDRKHGNDRAERAAGYARQLEETNAGLFAEPSVRFALAVSHRNQGLPRQSERFFLAMRRARQHDAWWACAQGEQWLAQPQTEPPKAIWRCQAITAKPRLDGRLDDAIWRTAEKIELRSPQHDDADWPAVAMLSYDAEFLYLAVSCARAPGYSYGEAETPPAARPRDADLAASDRVELYLDLDRDFATYYRLAIDHRGWTNDACWQDASWNPHWFVAAAGDSRAWTAEMAIPLAELTDKTPTSRHVWAVGAQRIVPGRGCQAWTTPSSVDVVPEGFGYLIFE